MNYNPNRISDNLDAIRTTDHITITANSGPDPALFGVTLANGIRYVFPFGADRAPVPSLVTCASFHLRWDNAIAFTATLEECSFPSLWPSDGARGVTDVADDALTPLGNWIPVRPPTAYVEVVGGGTYTIVTGVVAVAAGQQGGCTFDLSDWGARRGRINISVGGTGGLVRAAINGKATA